MDEKAYLAWLLDFYGQMLTPRQRQILSQHLDEDFSLSEIAKLENISRQSVHDTVKKAQAQLLALEERLGLLRRYFTLLDGATEALNELKNENAAAAIARLSQIIDKEGDMDGV